MSFIVRTASAGIGWKAPPLVELLEAASDLAKSSRSRRKSKPGPISNRWADGGYSLPGYAVRSSSRTRPLLSASRADVVTDGAPVEVVVVYVAQLPAGVAPK